MPNYHFRVRFRLPNDRVLDSEEQSLDLHSPTGRGTYVLEAVGGESLKESQWLRIKDVGEGFATENEAASSCADEITESLTQQGDKSAKSRLDILLTLLSLPYIGISPHTERARDEAYQRRQVFTLSFAPWRSQKTIRKAYRKGQGVVQGGDNQRMQEKTLAIMRFVTEDTDDEGNRQPWSQLTELWNEEHQGEGRFTSRFGLRKAYLRAEKELTRPWR